MKMSFPPPICMDNGALVGVQQSFPRRSALGTRHSALGSRRSTSQKSEEPKEPGPFQSEQSRMGTSLLPARAHFLKNIYFIFREREGGRERGRETLIGCFSHEPQLGTDPTTPSTCAGWG